MQLDNVLLADVLENLHDGLYFTDTHRVITFWNHAAERITGLDARHAAALGIRPGQRMNWAEARGRAASRVRPADLQRICNGCQWIALCQPALARLQPTARERCETSI